MFDRLTFKPVEGYDKKHKEDRLFEYGRGLQVSSQLLAEIISVKHDVRKMIQEEEFIHEAIKELPKVKNNDDMEFLRENKEALKEIRNVKPMLRPTLYMMVVELPPRLKKVYDKIRLNPTWIAKGWVDAVAEDADAVRAVT
ncbi:uncharacterized protein N7459_004016 [Penicillium hispanicum]|uniref:uncharacterized protein n=1 Tax=Penicillium hispanicum TaxID=1080232 RepID=UPI00253F7278|nr:uncharacterized protein N7459_004016 [Penicillium hispanicum]KAJ5584216.1 hypothetical protein N7459_004016 [Penicillium hispanicum]